MEILGIIVGIIVSVVIIYYALQFISWAILGLLHAIPMLMRLCFIVLVVWLAIKAVNYIGTVI